MRHLLPSRDTKPLLREMVEDGETYIVPGVYNPFTALLAEKQSWMPTPASARSSM